jgi:hypothetical protein
MKKIRKNLYRCSIDELSGTSHEPKPEDLTTLELFILSIKLKVNEWKKNLTLKK